MLKEAACGKMVLSKLYDLCSKADEPLSPNFWKNLEARTKRLFDDFGDLRGFALGLVLRLYKGLDALTLFLRDDLATKSNNFAEGLVRMAVCQRKISTGSAADKGERWIERSLTLRKSWSQWLLIFFLKFWQKNRLADHHPKTPKLPGDLVQFLVGVSGYVFWIPFMSNALSYRID